MKAVSARASYNPQVVEKLFGTPQARRQSVRAILAAQESGKDKVEVHGLVLTRRRVTVIQSG